MAGKVVSSNRTRPAMPDHPLLLCNDCLYNCLSITVLDITNNSYLPLLVNESKRDSLTHNRNVQISPTCTRNKGAAYRWFGELKEDECYGDEDATTPWYLIVLLGSIRYEVSQYGTYLCRLSFWNVRAGALFAVLLSDEHIVMLLYRICTSFRRLPVKVLALFVHY